MTVQTFSLDSDSGCAVTCTPLRGLPDGSVRTPVMRALEELDCGVAKASETEETRNKTKAKAERVFMVPPLPHARESKGWPAQRERYVGCRLRRYPGLAANRRSRILG